MDQTPDDLKQQLDELKDLVANNTIMINKLLLLINIADTDLKNHLDLLD